MVQKDFLIFILILEAKHLAWSNLPLMVSVKVGDKRKRYTKTVKHNDCPYYHETFVFDFYTTIDELRDDIIELALIPGSTFNIGTKKMLCHTRLDVGTVWQQPGHQFYRKWAVLLDPEDLYGRPKGYLKCSISILGRNETPKMPQISNFEDNVEMNLLFHQASVGERRRVRYLLHIYWADGLPNRVGSLWKTSMSVYVKATYAGHTGSTSAKKTATPVWNEQIIFTDMFPPLCQRIKIELKSKSSSIVIATQFLDLKAMSITHHTESLPTFGPAFLHLYGPSGVKDLDSGLMFGHRTLLGDGEGYRGRILLALTTDGSVGIPGAVNEKVSVGHTPYLKEELHWKDAVFHLFALIFDVSAMGSRVANKEISVEISLGNAGNSLAEGAENATSDEESDKQSKSFSSCEPMSAVTTDNIYYHLPFEAEKPCMSVRSKQPDLRRRMFNSNYLSNLAYSLKEELAELQSQQDDEHVSKKELEEVLLEFAGNWSEYLAWNQDEMNKVEDSGRFISELDTQRAKKAEDVTAHIQRVLVSVQYDFNKELIHQYWNYTNTIIEIIESLAEDPQDSLPDVFMWLLCDRSRIAFCRLPARELLYADSSAIRGHNCGKVQTLLMRAPGTSNPRAWTVEAMTDAYIWLGVEADGNTFMRGVPLGYKLTRSNKPKGVPTELVYKEVHTFQCRAHIFQGQFRPGMDRSGLSDPLVRVLVGRQSVATEVVHQTLNPTWNQLLVVEDVVVYGSGQTIKEHPPTITLHAMDKDRNGFELMGTAMVKPRVKLRNGRYEKPNFPPQLEMFKVFLGSEETGEIMAAFELLETVNGVVPGLPAMLSRGAKVPDHIRPASVTYRLEVYFWGVRDLAKLRLKRIDKPRITIMCAGAKLVSESLQSASKNLNFTNPIAHLDLNLPNEPQFLPPLSLTLSDFRMAHFQDVGIHNVKSMRTLLYPLLSEAEFKSRQLRSSTSSEQESEVPASTKRVFSTPGGPQLRETNEYPPLAKPGIKHAALFEKLSDLSLPGYDANLNKLLPEKKESGSCKWLMCCGKERPVLPLILPNPYDEELIDEEKLDWWTKYHSTKDASLNSALKIYPNELERQPEFEGFQDWLKTYKLQRGKRAQDEEENSETRVVGKIKCCMRLYPWPPAGSVGRFLTATGTDAADSVFMDSPLNSPVTVLVRIYVVRAYSLHPHDVTGKADPYIQVLLGNVEKFDDEANAVTRRLNPIFGRCYELQATFPGETMLTIRVMDKDFLKTNDLLGETKIDIEDRYYSKHRATCGIAMHYAEAGYNQWRDSKTPTQILSELCRNNRLPKPTYSINSLKIGTFELVTIPEESVSHAVKKKTQSEYEEELALMGLHRWHLMPLVGCHLVPEHVETRALYNHKFPGIDQGKLEMWVDLNPTSDVLGLRPAVNIKQREAEKFQLRVIVWNTDSVKATESDILSGKNKSDIYVKAWMQGPEDEQNTDVHYNSMTGEGNFNWRFIFPFSYHSSEKTMVLMKKESPFSTEETEYKVPCRLFLQVWDNDMVSQDDYIGQLSMDLSCCPRPTVNAKTCSLEQVTDKNYPMFSFFKQKRAKGWWPMTSNTEIDNPELVGKVELEMNLVTLPESLKNPVGHGRNEPEALPLPKLKMPFLKCLILLLFIALLVLYAMELPTSLARRSINGIRWS